MPPARKKRKVTKKQARVNGLQNGDHTNGADRSPEDSGADDDGADAGEAEDILQLPVGDDPDSDGGSDDGSGAEETQFPAEKLQKMFTFMLSSTEDRRDFIGQFSQHIDHEDVRRAGLENLSTALTAAAPEPSETLAMNLFSVLKLFRIKKKKKRKAGDDAGAGVAVEAGEHFDSLWLRLLSLPLTPALYRRVLILLPERVLPHLQNPLRLTDFLLSSYQIGGVVSVLSLQGVFYLMQHHNLEYPDFYSKLYSLLEPNALRSPQRARFFHLVDVFLSSGYLPEYLVAAFVKRLSRLALTAPAPAQTMLIRLVCSLMVRHRGLQRMTDDPRGATTLPADPFRAEEADPARCGAADSSLWEIKSLRGHLVPQVGRAASFVERELPQLEHPLDELLETTYDDLMEAELERSCADVALTFHRPEGLLSWKEDRLSTDWKL
ncbi:nucleolar complex protein 4 homolog [Amphibalanus amphitrite]|uniref:nucleolar complex protein 4 homolog n=1 Tax=Amphibalanus amphitrite TaxID=1232801 RepID=UPI001C913C31|nr:nucleolar complex protein 4 homolog [Amphibalanus amphitrite]